MFYVDWELGGGGGGAEKKLLGRDFSELKLVRVVLQETSNFFRPHVCSIAPKNVSHS